MRRRGLFAIAAVMWCVATWFGVRGTASEQPTPATRPNIESSRTHWDAQTLTIITTFQVADRGVGQPFTAELTRQLSLESPTILVVEVTRAGVLGGPTSTTRSTYRKN